jgi:lysophospholipase L1-like esterase
MRPIRMLTVGILTATATLAAFTIPANAATAVHYVALGDSYSSGVGTGTESGSCGRSSQAYPALWAAASSPASFTFAACAGATVPDIINSELSSLSSTTTLVSFTVGGNDAGWSSIMETCIFSSTSTCESDISAAEKSINASLPGELDTLISDIKAKSPNAKIIAVGYPHFYDLNVSVCIGLSSGDHQAINAGIDDLDSLLSAAASRDGATFADARPAFSGHELCSGNGWLHSVDIFSIGESYHPTATGQQDGYLPTFSTAAAKVGQ